MRIYLSSACLVLTLSIFVGMPPMATAQDEDEPLSDRSQSSWNFFRRPAKSDPSEQLAFAESLRETHPKKAGKQFKRLVLRWPDAPEAPAAQLAYAQILESQDKYYKAFDEYQYLVDHYAGRFEQYDSVLDSQFNMAKILIKKRKAKFLFMPGFEAPEQALSLLEGVVEDGPRWEGAPEAQYLIGHIHQVTDNYEDALAAYELGLHTYPDSTFAEKYAYGRAACLYLMAEETPHSIDAQKQAYAAITLYLKSYGDADSAAVAEEYKRTLIRRLAKVAYDRAVFYERVARKPEAALMEYTQFVKEFPSSEWTGVAEIRIDALQRELEK